MSLAKIVEEIKNGGKISREDALKIAQNAPKSELYRAADEIRKFFLGNKVETCSIMNAHSGRCPENCKWCAQSAHYKTGVKEYGYSGAEEALKNAKYAKQRRVQRFSLVTSGRKVPESKTEDLAKIYEEMKKVGIELCGSFGLLDKAQLKRLKDAGMTRYHCNLEAAPSFFPKLCSTHTIAEKLQTLRWAKELGYEICCGGIIAMGENLQERLELAFAISEIAPDSIPLNVLQPIKGTPLENTPPLSEDEILTAFAMFRIINPKAHIRFAGGRSAFKNRQRDALKAGASALLVGDMLTTIGSDINSDYKMLSEMGYEFLSPE
ncbi:MAG: biotin synthase BioB [Opitutales bacterium]|nr:biotin synthase BioB [Opitutales bacterium]